MIQRIIIHTLYKGYVFLKLEKYAQALKYYNKILKIDPDYNALLNNIGVIIDALKNYNEAIRCYDKLLKINPNDVYAVY